MGRISVQACSAFEQLFQSAMAGNLCKNSDDDVCVRQVAVCTAETRKDHTTVVLTSAALRFKVVSLFRVVNEPAAQNYYVPQAKIKVVTDALAEHCNLACGALNRSLIPYVAHMALSTPSVLVSTMTKVVTQLNPEHSAYFEVRINGEHLLDTAICVTAKAPVDFAYMANQDKTETGELELL